MNIWMWVLFMANSYLCYNNLRIGKPANTVVGTLNGVAAVMLLAAMLSGF